MASFQLARRRTPPTAPITRATRRKDSKQPSRLPLKICFVSRTVLPRAKRCGPTSTLFGLESRHFLTWCLEDSEFDIPFIVAKTRNAPRDKSKLREAVSSEVIGAVPGAPFGVAAEKTGNWLPLP